MNSLRKNLACAALIVVGFAWLYWSVIVKLVHDWATDDNYSHGFLIVPLAVYLAWERRQRFRRATARPSLAGLVVVGSSIIILGAGVLGSELFLARISMLGTLTGVVLFLFGWRRLRVLLFPLVFLLLMVPLPAIVFNQIAFPLQLFASRVGEFALGSLAIPVLREGNVLVLANTTLEVAEACSGIRSLVSLLTLGIVLAYFADSRQWVRTLTALSAVPVAIVANGARVAGTGIAAYQFGPAAAEGFLHTFSGWLVFVVAFLLMLAFQRLLIRLAPLTVPSPVIRAAA